MDDKQILIAAIRQAEKRKYKEHLKMLPVLPISPTSANLLMEKIFWAHRYEIIFSHAFAKALWGKRKLVPIKQKCTNTVTNEYEIINIGWEYHLQQMVLKKDYFKYLEKFLDDN